VGGVEGASWKYKRLCGVALAFQVSQTLVEFHADEASNVFAHDVAGFCFLNNTEHLRPERTVIA
jgi:hypothetical protein